MIFARLIGLCMYFRVGRVIMGDSRFSEAVYVFLTTRVDRVIMGDSWCVVFSTFGVSRVYMDNSHFQRLCRLLGWAGSWIVKQFLVE